MRIEVLSKVLKEKKSKYKKIKILEELPPPIIDDYGGDFKRHLEAFCPALTEKKNIPELEGR